MPSTGAAELSEDDAALRIQAQARRREASKKVEAMRQAKTVAGPASAAPTAAVAAPADDGDADADDDASGLSEEAAAIRIQSQARRLGASRRVESIRKANVATSRSRRPPHFSVAAVSGG